MIIRLKNANFSGNNIGTLSKLLVTRVLGSGAIYNGPLYVNNGAAFNASVTISDSYKLGDAGVVVTMGGNVLDNAFVVNGNTVNISIASVTGNVSINVPTSLINEEKPQYIFTIVPVPANATVKLNGVMQNSITVRANTSVSYEVSADGYETKTGEILVTKDENITITLVELSDVKNISAVRANYSGPQIPYGSTLDDLKQYLEVKVEYTDGSSEIVLDYELSGELKKESNNIITVTYGGKTTTFQVWVKKVFYKVDITTIPSDAKVTLNGKDSRSENVESGSKVTYEVSKNGYITQKGEITVTKNENITITLVKQTVDKNISAVRANYSGQTPYGSTLDDLRQHLEVKVEYTDGSYEFVTDYELSGELKKNNNNLITVTYGGKTTTVYVYARAVMCTVNITTIPSDAKVILNERDSRSENVESGSTVTYEVSKDGYETKTGEILVTKNENIIVELAVVKNVSAVRATSDGTQMPYGSTLNDLRQHLEVKAEYPDGSSEVVTDYELSGELKKNSNNKITVTYGGKTATVYVWVKAVNYTVNISAIPSDAKIMLNGRNSSSENVESGSIVTYEVSKNGYITQTGEILVTKNENITITLVKQTE